MKHRILIIDDDEDTLLLLKSYLIQSGYAALNIITCFTYAQASTFNGADIDIVLTDLGLPDSDTHDTFNRIKQLFPEKPVIVITSNAESGFDFKTIAAGAEDYLEKRKLNKDMLERAVRYALLRSQGASDYRRLFAENPAPMYIFDQESYGFLAVNNAALYQYGYSEEEFMQLTALAIRPAADQVGFLSVVRKPSNQYQAFGIWRHQRKNGSVFHVQVYAHSITFKGKTARLVMALDVDEAVLAKEALAQKVKENESILNSITDGFFAVDTSHRFIYVNPTFEKLFQKPGSEVTGRLIWDVFPEVKDTYFYRRYQQAITEKRSIHFEDLYTPLRVWLSVNAYPSENGLTAFFVDITEQKRMQETIYMNEQNLRASIDNTEDLIWTVDKDLKIISSNASFKNRMRQITGQEVNALQKEYFTKESYREWISYYDRAFGGEKFAVIRKFEVNKTERFEDVRFNPMYDRVGNIIGVSCFSRDITEQQRHILMIEEQNEKLRQISWFQSHELRKPVANIIGLTALINKEHFTSHPETLRLLEYLETSSQELDLVIRKIIDTGT
jgi:PAS domain S-box-containing protein